MINIIKIRIKIFLSNKLIVLLFVLFPILFSLLSLNYLKAEDILIKSTIGIVDEDNTEFSINLINRLKQDESLVVEIYNKSSGTIALNKEEIIGLYTIKDGFAKNIAVDNVNKLIEVRYLSDNYTAPGITDLITPYFLLDILKEKTKIKVNKSILNNDIGLINQFNTLFNKKAQEYEGFKDFELDVNVNSISGDFKAPLYELSKQAVIRYFLSIILIFIILIGFNQSIHTNTDKENRIISRIKLSKHSYFIYLIGNILGIAFILAFILTMQIMLMKVMFFNHINIFISIINIFIYALSISILSLMILMLLKNGSNFQTAIPYLIILIWLFGDWVYSDSILSSNYIKSLNYIPGMLIKGDIIKSFLNSDQIINYSSILKELTMQAVMALILYIKGKREYDKNVY